MSQSNPPLFPEWDCSWKACVCTAGACNSSETLLNKPKSKARTLTHLKTARLDDEIKWNFLLLLVWRECPVLDVLQRRCLISYSRPSLRQRLRQVGCKEPSGSLLWWKASGCHTNLIGWRLIAALWLDGALVNCNQSWSASWVHISYIKSKSMLTCNIRHGSNKQDLCRERGVHDRWVSAVLE